MKRASRLFPIIALLVAVGVAAAFTGWNMFHFPHYESDEGTYVASAWSLFREGQLSYYTYNYDHPPFGWFLIGLWATISGGFLAPGSSVDSGRLFMWIISLISTGLIFLIIQAVTGRTVAAVFAAILFAVSPLGVPLHRQVWIDNIAVAWLLSSIYLLVKPRRMSYVLLSALAFGAAFWSKEVMAVLLPGMIYLVHTQTDPVHRRFTVPLWGGTAITIISVFVLLAVLKDELLPPGVLWSSSSPHVSLVETYLWQAARPGNGFLLEPDSQFRTFFHQWHNTDPFLMLGGLAATAAALSPGLGTPFSRGILILAASFLLFLGRGGVVLYYYVIPLIALLALAFGLLVGQLQNWLGQWRWPRRAFSLATLSLLSVLSVAAAQDNGANFSGNRTIAQKDAARWLADNVSSHQVIYMDSYAWVDLREPSFTRSKPLLNAHYYWPGTADPAVRFGVLNDDWRNIDYLAFSPNIEADIQQRALPLLPDALAASDRVRTYYADDWTITIHRIRKLVEEEATSNRVLTDSWETYVHRFIDNGRVIDPKTDRSTTSEGQAYAMLRAVYMNDRTTFDRVWSWTRVNLQVRGDSLFSWKWGTRPDGTPGVLDPNAAADADQDIALALLFASRRWSAPGYQQEATRVLDGIWNLETVVAGGRRILVAGDWARGDWSRELDAPIVNPSYLAPYAYRIFAAADSSHPWLELVDSSYDILARVRPNWALGGPVGIVPDWLSIDSRNGDVQRADILGDKAHQFSFESARLPWRLALDWYWFKDNRAKEAAEALFLLPREINQSGRMAAAYGLDGAPKVEYESISIYAGALGTLLLSGDGSLAHKVFTSRILGQYVGGLQGGYWGDPDNYYDQNWGWFGTALMQGALGNLWESETVMKWERPFPGPVSAAHSAVPTASVIEMSSSIIEGAVAATLGRPGVEPSPVSGSSDAGRHTTSSVTQIFSIGDDPLRIALPAERYYVLKEEDGWALAIWEKDPPTWPVWIRRGALGAPDTVGTAAAE